MTKSNSDQILLRLPIGMRRRIKTLADRSNQSQNTWLQGAVLAAVETGERFASQVPHAKADRWAIPDGQDVAGLLPID